MKDAFALDRTLLPGSLGWFALGTTALVAAVVISMLQGEVPGAALPMTFVCLLAVARGVQLRRRHIERCGIRLIDTDRPG